MPAKNYVESSRVQQTRRPAVCELFSKRRGGRPAVGELFRSKPDCGVVLLSTENIARWEWYILVTVSAWNIKKSVLVLKWCGDLVLFCLLNFSLQCLLHWWKNKPRASVLIKIGEKCLQLLAHNDNLIRRSQNLENSLQEWHRNIFKKLMMTVFLCIHVSKLYHCPGSGCMAKHLCYEWAH